MMYGPMRAACYMSQCCDIPQRNALTGSESREDGSDRFGEGAHRWLPCTEFRSTLSPFRSTARMPSGTLVMSRTSLRLAMRSSPTQSLEVHAVTGSLPVRHHDYPLRRQAAIC